MLEGAVVAVDRTPVEVRTTAPGSATVALSKFREAGDFATSIRFASDAMSKPLSAPLTIHVKDRLTFPLLAILLGVAAGAWVSFATTTRRATLQARYNIAQLRLRLQLIAPAIMSATRAAQYQQITAQVNDAERAIELGQKLTGRSCRHRDKFDRPGSRLVPTAGCRRRPAQRPLETDCGGKDRLARLGVRYRAASGSGGGAEEGSRGHECRRPDRIREQRIRSVLQPARSGLTPRGK